MEGLPPSLRQGYLGPVSLREALWTWEQEDKRTFPFLLRESSELPLYNSADFKRSTHCNLVAAVRAVNTTQCCI